MAAKPFRSPNVAILGGFGRDNQIWKQAAEHPEEGVHALDFPVAKVSYAARGNVEEWR
jgi:hypothetical protein